MNFRKDHRDTGSLEAFIDVEAARRPEADHHDLGRLVRLLLEFGRVGEVGAECFIVLHARGNKVGVNKSETANIGLEFRIG